MSRKNFSGNGSWNGCVDKLFSLDFIAGNKEILFFFGELPYLDGRLKWV